MNKQISIGLLLLVVAFVAVPGVSALPSYKPGSNGLHVSAAAPDCAGSCHNMPVFCAQCHAYPYAAPTTTPTTAPTAAPTATPIIIPTTVTLSVGNTQTFTAKDQFNDTMIVTWNSSNETVGTIDANGKFTALALGTTNITASNGTVNMTASVIVSETPVLKSITLTAIVSAVGTQSFAAKAIDQFNNMVSSVVTWASSNPSVGTIDDNGKFTALTIGTTTITATNGTINGSALVIVMEPSTTLVKDSSKENKENKEEKEHKEDKEHKDGKGDLEEDDED
jgi:uncharacterized protein YjdB